MRIQELCRKDKGTWLGSRKKQIELQTDQKYILIRTVIEKYENQFCSREHS